LNGACAASPVNCIVDGVTTNCQQRVVGGPVAVTTSHPPPTRSRRERSRRSGRSTRQRRHRRKSKRLANTMTSLISVQFNFATRLAPSDGGGGNNRWQDEYHRAVYRLRTVFDDLENQLSTGNFRLVERVRSLAGLLQETDDSLTESQLNVICETGYSFQQDILLCLPCGPGSYFNYTLDSCVRCPAGTTQLEQGQIFCHWSSACDRFCVHDVTSCVQQWWLVAMTTVLVFSCRRQTCKILSASISSLSYSFVCIKLYLLWFMFCRIWATLCTPAKG
jgi:hypothetical protein